MTAPRHGWLRGPLPAFAAEALSAEHLRATGYFDPVAVTKLLADHRASRVNAGDLLLGVLGVELWHSMFMQSELRPPQVIHDRRTARGAALASRA